MPGQSSGPLSHLPLQAGRLGGVRYVASPNFDARPAGVAIDLLVIHNISLPPGEFGGGYIEALFQNRLPAGVHPYLDGIRELRVSAHLLIDRGGRVTQFVPFGCRAWHAGESQWEGRSRCNDFSIGIELEGTDELAYSEAQYRTLIRVTGALRATYPGITAERIVGHCDVAPGRKSDPGPAFDWDLFRAGLESGGD